MVIEISDLDASDPYSYAMMIASRAIAWGLNHANAMSDVERDALISVRIELQKHL